MPQKQISKEEANQIAVEYLKKEKKTDKIDVAMAEQQHDGWAFKGTCPINLEGHTWAEKFEVVVDVKGKIKKTDYALL